jgi:hypothetical protein
VTWGFAKPAPDPYMGSGSERIRLGSLLDNRLVLAVARSRGLLDGLAVSGGS